MGNGGMYATFPELPCVLVLRICQSSLALTAPRLRLRRQPPFHGTVPRSRQVCEFATSTSTHAMARMPIITSKNGPGKLRAEKRAALQSVLVGSGNGKCNAAIESFLNDNGIQKIEKACWSGLRTRSS